MAAEVVVVGSCMTDLVRLVPGGAPAGRQAPARGRFPALTGRRGPEVKGAQGVTEPRAERRLPAPPKGRLGRDAPRPSYPGPRKAGVTSLSRPGQEKWGRRQVGRRGALGPGQREPRLEVGCGRGRGKDQSRRWGRLGPGDVSPANNTLKEDCGNGEKFERVVCWSFDQLSVT